MPLVNLGYLTHPFDILAFKEGIRIAKRWFEGPAYEGYITGFLGPDPDVLPEDEFENALKERVSMWWHPVGTVSMSPKGAKYGVLDPDLRVKGVKGLRVVDASAIVSILSFCLLPVVVGSELTVWLPSTVVFRSASLMFQLRIPKLLCTSLRRGPRI